MAKEVKVRKINRSLVITLPHDICKLYEINEGTLIDLEPQASDVIRLVVRKP